MCEGFKGEWAAPFKRPQQGFFRLTNGAHVGARVCASVMVRMDAEGKGFEGFSDFQIVGARRDIQHCIGKRAHPLLLFQSMPPSCQSQRVEDNDWRHAAIDALWAPS